VGALARGAPFYLRGVLRPLQQQVARIVSSLPQARGFALAGGATLVVARVVDRSTKDLDFFGPSADDVHRLLEAPEPALANAGLTVHRERVGPSFVRLTVMGDDDATEVDLAADARMRPVDSGPLGPMLSIEELAADKLLALFDRAQARDFVDVAALVERFGLDRLCDLAKEKDAGFSRPVLRDMLGGFDRFNQTDFGLDDTAYVQLSRQVRRWRAVLSPSPPPSTDPPHHDPSPGALTTTTQRHREIETAGEPGTIPPVTFRLLTGPCDGEVRRPVRDKYDDTEGRDEVARPARPSHPGPSARLDDCPGRRSVDAPRRLDLHRSPMTTSESGL
jgi:hypothetical protein